MRVAGCAQSASPRNTKPQWESPPEGRLCFAFEFTSSAAAFLLLCFQ